MSIVTSQKVLARLRRWFPTREFFMRSDGRVRFVRVSTRTQIVAAGSVAALLLVWIGVLGWALVAQLVAGSQRAQLAQREAAVAQAEAKVARYRNGIGGVAQELERRQDYLDKMIESHVGELPAAASATPEKVSLSNSAAGPDAARFARIEARQLALIDTLTKYADARTARAETAIRRVGLNPAMIAAADRKAMGGPLIRAGTAPSDPRFAAFGRSLERMTAMQNGLARIPNTLPASLEYISSGFGYRADPFDGSAAFHAGLDFRGPVGAPIFAAAAGSVSFTGVRQGYGNCVEISHGNGLMTRYAHMSRIGAKLGQKVDAGAVIGQIGSTGRSTGPHLHFEVRINDRPVNPRPFLEANRDVFQQDHPHRG
ncbi:peptidoglycan DD-metalloendopeptidase family protein [Novosphingobium sp.]|uniref:peptidoglycan DD-metalloendopeptidase family protein n=1 Tax=Novosphingobium sp. TaxID=1874826 RepID=UPI0038B87382